MHGATLGPVAEKIRCGGAKGKWKQNLERDTIRTISSSGALDLATDSDAQFHDSGQLHVNHMMMMMMMMMTH